MSVSIRLNDGTKVDVAVADLDGETVAGLKALISAALPGTPAVALIKLVFKGRVRCSGWPLSLSQLLPRPSPVASSPPHPHHPPLCPSHADPQG